MSLHLVTGHKGTAHVTAEDHGALNAAIFGDVEAILETGRQMEASAITPNIVRIYDGDLIMQGRHIRIVADTYEDVAIENGTVDKNRNDLIVVRYTKEAETGIEGVAFAVIKGTETSGTASDPAYTKGDILSEACLLHEMPLYRVCIEGINVVGVELLAPTGVAVLTNHKEQVIHGGNIVIEDDRKLGDGLTIRRAKDDGTKRTLAAYVLNKASGHDGYIRVYDTNEAGTKTEINSMRLGENNTRFGKPVSVNSGGTGNANFGSVATGSVVVVNNLGDESRFDIVPRQGAGALYHDSANVEYPEFGTLPIHCGGTGAKIESEARKNLGVLGNSGLQILNQGTLRILDENSTGQGFAVRRKHDDGYKALALQVYEDSAYLRSVSMDADGNNQEVTNYILLKEGETKLGKPLAIGSGGTGATTVEGAMLNLGIGFADLPFNASGMTNGSTTYAEPTVNANSSIVLKIGSQKFAYVHLRMAFKPTTAIPADTFVPIASALATNGDFRPSYMTPLNASNSSVETRWADAYINTSGMVFIRFSTQVGTSTSIIYTISGWYKV